jgi:hypothetical protein
MSFSIKDLMGDSSPQPQSTAAPTPTAAPSSAPAASQTFTRADFEDKSSQPSQPSQTAPGSFSMRDLMGDESSQPSQVETDPRKTGEIVNDVGQKVIVPKDGESFSDTVKRAVAYHKSLTPEQQQAALNAEAKTAPKKAAQTLGAAAAIGAVGPALLAAPGEIAEALPSVLTHTIDGVKAVTAWASKNPVQAYLLFQVMKELVPGAKKAIGVVKGVPEAE